MSSGNSIRHGKYVAVAHDLLLCRDKLSIVQTIVSRIHYMIFISLGHVATVDGSILISIELHETMFCFVFWYFFNVPRSLPRTVVILL